MERAQEAISALTERLPDSAAPPRKNGELVFEAPWQSRAFGMAVALHGAGTYRWEEFSARLAAAIAASGSGPVKRAVLPVAAHAEDEYYERWLEALERLLMERGVVSGEELEVRTAEFAAGLWDHGH
jgi:nitrile hydratase accessory protein